MIDHIVVSGFVSLLVLIGLPIAIVVLTFILFSWGASNSEAEMGSMAVAFAAGAISFAVAVVLVAVNYIWTGWW